MSTTPQSHEKQASLIREMNRSLSASRQEAGNLMPDNDTSIYRSNIDLELTNQDFTFPSDIGLDDELGFQDLDRPMMGAGADMRSTAKKYAFYHPPSPPQHIPSSAVRREFLDFDQNDSHDQIEQPVAEESSVSVEVGRGLRRSVSYRDPVSPARDAVNLAKSHLGGEENLRKTAQIRSASNAQKALDMPQKPSAFKKSRVPSYAETSARILADYHESSFVSEKLSPQSVKPSRFLKPRQVSAGNEMPSRFVAGKGLQPASHAKPAGPSRAATISVSRPGLNNSTKLSFIIPDLENLTEVMSSQLEPSKSIMRSSRSRSRFPGAAAGSPSYAPIASLPVPDDEKKIMASLRILKESVANLRRENTELRRRCDGQEYQLLQLQEAGEDGHAQEVSVQQAALLKLEQEYKNAQTKLHKVQQAKARTEDTVHQLTSQRDMIFVESERLNTELHDTREEKRAVQRENGKLRKTLDRLEDECQYLHDLLYEAQTAADVERAPPKAKTAAPSARQKKTTVADDGEVLTPTGQALKTQNARLRVEIDRLNSELEDIKNMRESEARNWSKRETDLRQQVLHRDETLRQLQDGLTGVMNVGQDEVKAAEAPRPAQPDEGLQDVLDRFVSLHTARKQFRAEEREAKLQSLRQLDEQHQDETQEWKFQQIALVDEIDRRNRFSEQFESCVRGIVGRAPVNKVDVPAFDARPAVRELGQKLGAAVKLNVGGENTVEIHTDVNGQVGPGDEADPSPLDTQVIRDLRLRVEKDFLSRDLGAGPVDLGDIGESFDDGMVDQTVKSAMREPAGQTSAPPPPTHTSGLVSSGPTLTSRPKTESEGSGDETMRPSQPPLQALDTVIADIESDIKQLHMNFATLDCRLSACNPKQSRRVRKSLIDNMIQILSHLDVNSERVYQLQDARYGLAAGGSVEPDSRRE